MLSYALAIAVAISSFVLFLTAFFMSDIHRKDDFLWSPVGLFYALVLWFCARNITGAVLLGQAAASLLLVSFVWQTLKLRKAVANPEQAVEISNFSVLRAVNGLLAKNKKQPQVKPTSSVEDSADVVTESKIAIPQTTSTEAKSPASDRKINQKNKTGVFGKVFGRKKTAITNTKLDTVLDESVKTEADTSPPPEKQANVAPPADIKSELGSKPETVVEPLVEKPEIKDKDVKKTDIPQPESIKQEVKVDPAKIVEPEKPSSQSAVKTVKTVEEEAVENQTSDTSNVELPVETKPEVPTLSEQPQASAGNIVRDNSERETEITKTQTNSESEVVPTETVEEAKVIESKTKASDLDSLETVEVAEVLEALPEDSSKERTSDRANIIEVTTTDIEEVTETSQPKEDSQSD